MPAAVVYYAFAFDGAPVDPGSRGWFAAPTVPHLLAVRARTALGRASGSQVMIYRCDGEIAHGSIRCEQATLIHVGDATHELRWFALYCARSVANRWTPPHLVKEFLVAADPELRDIAFQRARAAFAVTEDVSRMAARVTMYATADDDPAVCAREACKLASRIASLDKSVQLPQVKAQQERALASTLLARANARARTGEEPDFRLYGFESGDISDSALRDSSELPTAAA